MVKSSRFHYASHCVALHYDSDDVGFDNDVALAGDDDDDTSDNDNNLPSPYILDLFFFLFFHDAFPSDTLHLIRLIKHLDLLCGNDQKSKISTISFGCAFSKNNN